MTHLYYDVVDSQPSSEKEWNRRITYLFLTKKDMGNSEQNSHNDETFNATSM
jgi:hypothetical protein